MGGEQVEVTSECRAGARPCPSASPGPRLHLSEGTLMQARGAVTAGPHGAPDRHFPVGGAECHLLCVSRGVPHPVPPGRTPPGPAERGTGLHLGGDPRVGSEPHLLGLGSGAREGWTSRLESEPLPLSCVTAPGAPRVGPGGRPLPLVRALVMVWEGLQGRVPEPPWWKAPRSAHTGGGCQCLSAGCRALLPSGTSTLAFGGPETHGLVCGTDPHWSPGSASGTGP